MKNSRPKVAAVILAAGSSRRMGGNVNKIFSVIDGMSVIARAVSAFEEAEIIDKIFLVSSEQSMQALREEMLFYKFKKTDSILLGGDSRTLSVKNAVDYINGFDYVAIHDGARPLVTPQIIEDTVLAAFETGAAIVGVKAVDTIKTEEASMVKQTLDRNFVWQIQTPQVFGMDILKKMYENPDETTDDSCLAEKLGIKVALSPGSRENIKITTTLDLHLAQAILNFRGNL